MEVQGQVDHATDNQNDHLVDELSPQDEAKMGSIVHPLFAVEFPHQSNLLHYFALMIQSLYQLTDLSLYAKARNVFRLFWLHDQTIFNNSPMLRRNNHAKSVWRRKKSGNDISNIEPDGASYEQLKSMSKRLAIISRLECKQNSDAYRRINKTYSKLDIDYQTSKSNEKQVPKRPSTTNEKRKANNLNTMKEVFKEEKRINEYLIAERNQPNLKTSMTYASESVKEGLLGEYNRYNQMSKPELIQKLISLEYLANNIFRKNKALEQRIKSLDPTYNIS